MIDHPVRGSKDIADCLAAAVHHVEEGWRRAEGARGMFQFGAVEREIAALVGQKAHALIPILARSGDKHHFLMGERIGSVSYGGLDILAG